MVDWSHHPSICDKHSCHTYFSASLQYCVLNTVETSYGHDILMEHAFQCTYIKTHGMSCGPRKRGACKLKGVSILTGTTKSHP